MVAPACVPTSGARGSPSPPVSAPTSHGFDSRRSNTREVPSRCGPDLHVPAVSDSEHLVMSFVPLCVSSLQSCPVAGRWLAPRKSFFQRNPDHLAYLVPVAGVTKDHRLDGFKSRVQKVSLLGPGPLLSTGEGVPCLAHLPGAVGLPVWDRIALARGHSASLRTPPGGTHVTMRVSTWTFWDAPRVNTLNSATPAMSVLTRQVTFIAPRDLDRDNFRTAH